MSGGRLGKGRPERRVSLGTALVFRSGPFQGPAGSFAILAACALAMLCFVEITLAFPLTLPMTLVFVLCCSLLFFPYLLVNRSGIKWIIAALFLGAVLVIHLLSWNTRKPFLKDLRSVDIGMTAAQVDRVMEHWMTGNGSPVRSTLDAIPPSNTVSALAPDLIPVMPAESPPGDAPAAFEVIAYRHSNEPRFQADRGMVRFKDGRVVAVEFFSD